MNETIDMVKKLVTDKGFPVLIKTPFCEKYLEDHNNNCDGCESEAGCSRMCALSIVMMLGATYKPKDFDDMCDMTKKVCTKMSKILDPALSIKELKEATL